MLTIAFISCADLSRYHFSKLNPLLTHDDQAACDFLQAQGHTIKAIAWGMPIHILKELSCDLIIIRSPWDYMESEQKRQGFMHWLSLLNEAELPLENPYQIMRWNLDKRYLLELGTSGVPIPQTLLLSEDELSFNAIDLAVKDWHQAVVKPCIGAAAQDTYLLNKNTIGAFFEQYSLLKPGRAFLLQPFIPTIAEEGEWSCIFFNNSYSHAVLKRPQKGHWLVQDERGGTVESAAPPSLIKDFALHTYEVLRSLLKEKSSFAGSLLYARIDIMPGPLLGEIELVEPELFFLDRPGLKPNKNALEQFHEGIQKRVKKSIR